MDYALGTCGIAPRDFYAMTPRELMSVARGQRLKVKHMALATGVGFGGEWKAIDRFFGDDDEAARMGLQEYEALKRRAGYAGEA